MEIYQLRSFIAVAETGNLTKAARKIHISQSALSSQIKSLEEELNTDLFIRSAKGMTLTHQGTQILKDAEGVIAAVTKLIQNAGENKKNKKMILNIGLNTDPNFLNITGISKKIFNSMPSITINYIGSKTIEVCEMLRNKKIDIGFMYGDVWEKDLHFTRISSVTVCVVIPENIAKDMDEPDLSKIAALPWIWTSCQCPFHLEFRKILDTDNLSVNQTADAVEESIVRELVKDNTGLALMRLDEAESLEKKGYVRIWNKIKMQVPLNIGCLVERMNEPAIKEALEQTELLFRNI